jgi:hypothetical protein
MTNTTDLNDVSLVGESFMLVLKKPKIGKQNFYITKNSFVETNENVEETIFSGKGAACVLTYDKDVFIIVEAIDMPLENYTTLKEFKILHARGVGYLLVDLKREEFVHV